MHIHRWRLGKSKGNSESELRKEREEGRRDQKRAQREEGVKKRELRSYVDMTGDYYMQEENTNSK